MRTSCLIPWDKTKAELIHLHRISSRPDVPGMSSREKSGDVLALWPMTMKVRMASIMMDMVDGLFVSENWIAKKPFTLDYKTCKSRPLVNTTY